MNKNIIYSALALALMTTTVGCQSDEYVAPDSFSDVCWAINQTADTQWTRNQGEWAGFLDMSVGALSHFWEIEKGNYFLDKIFDDDLEDYTPYILTTGFTETETTYRSTELQVNVLFNNAGTSTVRLRNTFAECVTTSTSTPLTSYYDEAEGVWVLDTCLEMTVYPTILPAFNVYRNAECTDLVISVPETQVVDPDDTSAWSKVTIEAAESLYYVDMITTGDPGAISWSFDGASAATATSTDSVAVATYYSMGEFTGSTLTATRSWPSAVASETKYVPLIVEVIKSTQPYEITATPSVDGSMIYVNMTGELSMAPSAAVEDFTVYVSNEDAGITLNSSLITPTGLVIQSDPTILGISIKGDYYNSDEIFVSYAGSSSEEDALMSVDDRTFTAFSQTAVTLPDSYFTDICVSSSMMGFEEVRTSATGGCWSNGWWCNATTGGFYQSTLYIGESMASSGSGSLKFSAPAGTTAFGAQFQSGGTSQSDSTIANTFTLSETGTYIIRFDVYVASSANSELDYIALTAVDNSKYWLGAAPSMLATDVARDQWVTVDTEIECTEVTGGTSLLTIKVGNHSSSICATDDVLLYLDNIRVIKKNPRP